MKQIQDFAEQLNLTITTLSAGSSLFIGCTFWETKYPYVYITDYDLNLDNNSLIEKNIVTIFYKHKGFFASRIVSFQMFTETKFMNHFIDEFYEETLKSEATTK